MSSSQPINPGISSFQANTTGNTSALSVRTSLGRQCKKKNNTTTTNKCVKRRKRKLDQEDMLDNRLVLNLNNTPPKKRARVVEIIEKTGAREAELSTPTRDEEDNMIANSPGGTQFTRLFSNFFGSAFLPSSPFATEDKMAGKAHLESARVLNFGKLEKIEKIEFTATLNKLIEDKWRNHSQKTLAGESSKDFFVNHDAIIFEKPEGGSNYHLYHVIGFELGGPHESRNIVPSTANANYNCLDLIERPIRELLLEKKTEKVHVTAKLIFESNKMIPSNIHYLLSWRQKGTLFEEEIRINPRSYDRIPLAERYSIRMMRDHSFFPECRSPNNNTVKQKKAECVKSEEIEMEVDEVAGKPVQP